MVKLRDGREDELAALMASQARDAATWRVKHGPGVVNECDLDMSLDRLPWRESAPILLIEGRAHEWGEPLSPTCPTCHGQAGGSICLRCDGGAEGRNLRGRVNPDAGGGVTTYAGDADGLKGGMGR